MAIQITRIRKPDRDSRHEAISHYGVLESNGQVTVHERIYLIGWLQQNSELAYVSQDSNVAFCDIRNNGNTVFLQTRSDASESNNLLSLPSC